MIPEQWVSEIINRFPYYQNKSEGEQSALRADLIDFSTGKEPAFLDELLSEFRTTEFKKAPGMWWFYKRLNSTTNNASHSKPMWRKCRNCGVESELRDGPCPSCGTMSSCDFTLIRGNVMPSSLIQQQDGCSQCNWFEKSLSGEDGGSKRLYGPGCKDYGKQEYAADEICKSCKCADCCRLTYLMKNDPDRYRARYGSIVDSQMEKMFKNLETNTRDRWKRLENSDKQGTAEP